MAHLGNISPGMMELQAVGIYSKFSGRSLATEASLGLSADGLHVLLVHVYPTDVGT